ncbi:DUF2577 domain-containing protein [Lactococcus petauri]|uniref:DUF2577 domain-containing protein n=1 Tax=Lactococcus petauri TaxID=1940789 RepID=UPI0038525EDB
MSENVNKLVKLINKKGGKPSDYADMLYGKVISSNPLTVKVDTGLELTSDFLELGKFKGSRKINISGLSVKVDGKDYQISGTATISENLEIGDNVSLMRGHGGQRFYIMDRS